MEKIYAYSIYKLTNIVLPRHFVFKCDATLFHSSSRAYNKLKSDSRQGQRNISHH